MKSRNALTIGVIVILAWLAASCTPIPMRSETADLDGLGDALSGEKILGHVVADSELPDVNFLEMTPEMEEFAKRAIHRGDDDFEKIKSLHSALISPRESGGHGIIYNAYFTEVPSVTFAQGRANCLSFTLLYVALARSVGIAAKVNEVEIPPTWDLRNKKDMVFLRHVNVKVPISRDSLSILHTDDVVIDLEMNRFHANYNQRIISDESAGAQFYSNRAMELLSNDKLEDAFLNLRKSIRLDDRQSYVWSNLGVLYSRKNAWREAEAAYLQGLTLNPDDLTIMNNLSALYSRMNDEERAAQYTKLAQGYRDSNPFYQYNLALSAFDKGDYSAASQLIRRAMVREKNDARFYQLAAAIYEKQGDSSRAQSMLRKLKKRNGL